MRGEARRLSICLQPYARLSLGPISRRKSQRLNSELHKRHDLSTRRYHSTVSISVLNVVWHTSKMNPGLIIDVHISAIPLKIKNIQLSLYIKKIGHGLF